MFEILKFSRKHDLE